MASTNGIYRLGPETGRLLVKTGRTGIGRKAGHDLTIEVTRWSAKVVVDTADPGRSSVTATIEVDSLEVREGVGGLKPLTDSDRADIKKTIRDKILHTAEHPAITFTSTEITGTPQSASISGDLTIMGRTHPVTVHAKADNGSVRGGATVAQTRWGITPHPALGGALRLADEVQIEFEFAEPA